MRFPGAGFELRTFRTQDNGLTFIAVRLGSEKRIGLSNFVS
jgi:hypothetical protein